MIGYTLVGTNNFEKAVEFYDALFSSMGIKQFASTDRIQFWQAEGNPTMFGVCKPADGNEATNGNGTMIALPVPDRATVEAMYHKALELGGESACEPVEGSIPNFYAGYVRDLDGNKICFFNM